MAEAFKRGGSAPFRVALQACMWSCMCCRIHVLRLQDGAQEVLLAS
jgi:hypothetical protein